MDTTPVLQELICDHLIEKTDILVLILSSTGVIEEANTPVANLVGFSPVGKSFEELVINFKSNFSYEKIHDSDNLHLLNVMKASGLPLTYYFRFIPNSDKIIAIGQQDSDEIDKMRRDLISLNSDLNNLTRELHKKNVQLTRLNEQQNQVFGMASHDLRHPLGIISMYSNFLATEVIEELSPNHQDFLNYICKSSALMENILNDFLDFSTFEAGSLNLTCTDLELASFLQDIVTYTEQVAEQKGISLRYVPVSAPIRVYIDSPKIEQVMNNLISNALKFTPKGTEIVISTAIEGDKVIIMVADQGPGIEQQHLDTIFQPFHKLRSQQAAEEKSSGLGLAIVKKIIEAHGGAVWAKSKPGEGAVFHFSLPC